MQFFINPQFEPEKYNIIEENLPAPQSQILLGICHRKERQMIARCRGIMMHYYEIAETV